MEKYIRHFKLLKRNILRNLQRLSWNETALQREQGLISAVNYVSYSLVDGDIAEFGVSNGFSASYISYALSRIKKNNKALLLFDSFQGLPEIKSIASGMKEVAQGKWKKGDFKGNPESVRKKCEKYINNLKIYPGWFNETLPQLPENQKFALVHVDCDLYESTEEVLNYIFSKSMISQGAMICFDEFNASANDNENGERRAWLEAVKKFSIKSEDAGMYGFNCRRFIIQNYKA
ncbi:MAG: hypothetical protein A2822_04515 [Candidatus Staskawiczbacteria bacterium RIFCSPHIGHO2_01_FULL_41_41]|uniref:Methyltransferase n=1 Tax=Candidatus Staskawiczbacteria bacterium RIFCSPHIGHO2_01_FULL_41_41 TaxID=1802203 RepID=A0A1G2HRX6_9BACT|nr:MAG: hypothetical protein A2822_04515 [Candidatus Staskawiczbacteria bacterium RIFCSPHIGHO2_01_FULL_41_41]HLD80274.1 TylF/MycF/NovP-related O-methyltransferase [Candidatus Nanoarchaeia archaeon]